MHELPFAPTTNVVPFISRSPSLPKGRGRSTMQRARVLVIDNVKGWLAVIALAAIALIGVGAFADRLLGAPLGFSCEAPPTSTR